MSRQLPIWTRRLVAIAILVSCGSVVPAQAQNASTAGQNWSSSWGFASAADRGVALQQAQAIRQAQMQPGPSTLITNTTTNSVFNDNRSNYQEVLGETLAIDSIDFQLNGDRIGQNTNSVGSMNTGTTYIDVVGSGNHIVATNAAETQGCVDGSIQLETSLFEAMASPSGIDISVSASGRDMSCAP